MTEPTTKLPRAADELLRDFPLAEPDFEAQARAIEARLQASSNGGASDALFQAVELAPEAGEPALPSTVHAAPRPAGSLAEMARKSLQKQSAGVDDGAALAKELLAATSHRRPDAEMVARVRAAGKASATSTPMPEERTSGVVPRAVAPAPAAQPASTPAASKRGAVLAALGGALALAAAVALYLNVGSRAQTSAEVALSTAAPATSSVAHADNPSTPSTASPIAHGEGTADGVVSPDSLPLPAATAVDGAKPMAARAPALEVAAGSRRPSAAGSATKRDAGKLDDAMRAATDAHTAEPPAEPAMKPAEGSTDSVPLSPSGGAVSTALGAVRGDAQACLAGQDRAVVAVITFASDGHVASVSAAGPSGPCIQAALSKARVSPFAKERFSATTTIRPP